MRWRAFESYVITRGCPTTLICLYILGLLFNLLSHDNKFNSLYIESFLFNFHSNLILSISLDRCRTFLENQTRLFKLLSSLKGRAHVGPINAQKWSGFFGCMRGVGWFWWVGQPNILVRAPLKHMPSRCYCVIEAAPMPVPSPWQVKPIHTLNHQP